jgi:hypothetical protein
MTIFFTTGGVGAPGFTLQDFDMTFVPLTVLGTLKFRLKEAHKFSGQDWDVARILHVHVANELRSPELLRTR